MVYMQNQNLYISFLIWHCKHLIGLTRPSLRCWLTRNAVNYFPVLFFWFFRSAAFGYAGTGKPGKRRWGANPPGHGLTDTNLLHVHLRGRREIRPSRVRVFVSLKSAWPKHSTPIQLPSAVRVLPG